MKKQIQPLEGIISVDKSNRGNEPEIRKLKETGLYQIQSFSNPGVFYVVDTTSKTCTCPQFTIRGVQCKHIKAAENVEKRMLAERESLINFHHPKLSERTVFIG